MRKWVTNQESRHRRTGGKEGEWEGRGRRSEYMSKGEREAGKSSMQSYMFNIVLPPPPLPPFLLPPHLIPSCIASLVPIMLMARSMLLQILTAWPEPWDPQRTTFLPIQSNSGLARSNASLVPPTMNVRAPFLAAPTPERVWWRERNGRYLIIIIGKMSEAGSIKF